MYRIISGKRFILASGSPRRRELLETCGLCPEVIVSHCDETSKANEAPQALVERLAALKAGSVADLHRDAWVLGGDTIVVLKGDILGKPESPAHAESMLQRMQGATHEVWGAFAVRHVQTGVCVVESHRSVVTMVPMADPLIKAYVRTGEPLDKAGSYALQGIGASFVAAVEGSHSNVIGLNLAAVLGGLQRLGVIEIAE